MSFCLFVILSFCLFSLSPSLSGIQVHPELQESFFKGGDSRNWFIFSLIGNRADNPSLLHNLRPAGPAYKVHYLLLTSTCTSHQIVCNVHKKCFIHYIRQTSIKRGKAGRAFRTKSCLVSAQSARVREREMAHKALGLGF